MEIKKDGMTVKDTKGNLIETKDGITCGCGNPLLKMVYHADGIDFYSSEYRCVCGNSISMECIRDKEDLMYWED